MKEKIDIIKLKNGFNCCFREICFYQKFVTMALTVKVGSVLEHNGEKGIAHLLEHLLMSFLTFDLYHDVRYRAKAYTDFNETIFYIKCPADINNFKEILKIVYEIAKGKFIDEKYFQRAKTDVLNEIRGEQKNQSMVNALLNKSEYLSHLALGNEEDVMKMTYEDVKEFFEQNYFTNIMSLSIVGDVSVDMKKYVIDLFTNLDNGLRIRNRKTFLIPDYKDEVEYIDISEKGNSELSVIIKVRKAIFESKENIAKIEIIEKVALDLLITELEKYLKQKELDIKYEYKELDAFYIFYIIKIKKEKLDKNKSRELIDEIIYFLNNLSRQDIDDTMICELLEQFYEIEYDEELYYQETGIHQQLLECIDYFIAGNPVMTYEERYMLYKKISKEIKTEEVYKFLESIKMEGKMFIVNL